MAIQQKQTVQQRLLFAPNITLALEVLRMTTMELQTFLHQQLEENPMLELEESEESSEDEASEPESVDGREESQPEGSQSAELDEEWLSHWRTGGGDETEDGEESRSLEEIGRAHV